jgi:hypothetical protein
MHGTGQPADSPEQELAQAHPKRGGVRVKIIASHTLVQRGFTMMSNPSSVFSRRFGGLALELLLRLQAAGVVSVPVTRRVCILHLLNNQMANVIRPVIHRFFTEYTPAPVYISRYVSSSSTAARD